MEHGLSVVASIEARMSSSRLPGKVLADVRSFPALTRLLRRLRFCTSLDDIVLATSDNRADDPLIEWADNEGVAVFRGSEDDVLSRVVGAHIMMGSDVIVEVTGDSILSDPSVIDMGVDIYMNGNFDVVSNTWNISYPMGVDVQVFGFDILSRLNEQTLDESLREHVTLYFYEHPELYKIWHLMAPDHLRAPEYRFQLDYIEDLKFVNEIYKLLEPTYGDRFGVKEILAEIRKDPALAEINMHCQEKPLR